MSKKEVVYGVQYSLPSIPHNRDIENYTKPKREQKFERVDFEPIFRNLDFDEEGNPLFTDEMIAFINRELDRIDDGYWFYNNGSLTYITGHHYMYMNYWTLENGDQPDYRDCDRRWWYFKDYCEKTTHVDGIIRSKKRREGATSQECCDLVRTALRQKKAFCGVVSKTGDDAKTAFIDMIKNGFEKLPIFLVPLDVEDPDSQTSIVFRKPKNRNAKKTKSNRRRGQVFEDDKGIGSRINYKATKLNSYDSGRLTEVMIDEGGKFPTDVPVNEYWPIVRKTLKMGGKRVGFAVLPSTSNKLTKGGRGFKVLWDDSNHFENKVTGTGLYRYFCPAYDGYVPYIDEYGMSILDKPTKEQAKYMKEKYGADDLQCSMSAKEYLLHLRSMIRDPATRNEEIRMNPLNEGEAFDFDDNSNIYNMTNIRDQKERIMEVRPKIRQVRFTRDGEGMATWVDDKDGMWWVLDGGLPSDEEKNKVIKDPFYGTLIPGNKSKYAHTADPYKNTIITGPGSKGAGFIWKKLNPLDKENSGMPVAMFWGRPRRKRVFHEQQLLAAEYWGCEMCYESDYDEYIEFLEGEGKMIYAMVRPKNTIDPNKKKGPNKKKEYGIKSGDGFSYTMMIDKSVEYIDFYCGKIWFLALLEQLEEYDVDERTKFDLAVAFQLGTVVISEQVQKKPASTKPIQIVKTYQLT